MTRVVIVQRRLTDYRVPLFERMRVLLAAQGVTLDLVVGDATPEERRKRDQGHLDWALYARCRYALGGRLCWQNFGPFARNADLVVVTQENKLLYNLLALTILRPRRLAFWGHGRNMQARNTQSLRERFKRWTTCAVDWWFAYNELSAGLVRQMGFPADRVTSLDNAIDTSALREQIASVTAEEVQAFRRAHDIGAGPCGVFLGSLYAEKRIGFLLEAARAVAARCPGFVLMLAGDGPDRSLVEAQGETPWLRYLGPVRGRDKAVLLRSADLMLNPGLVGLGILDAFCAGLPMVTTDCHLHSPEIAYLESGRNGVMTGDSMEAFVAECTRLIADPAAREVLRQGAETAGMRYTIENMAQLFCAGIQKSLLIDPA